MKPSDFKKRDDSAPTLRSSLADKLRAAFDLSDVPEPETTTDAEAPEENKP